MNTKQKAYMKC